MSYQDLWDIPIAWEWTTLDKIALINMGQSPSSSTYNTQRIGLPFYQGKADFGPLYPTPRIFCSAPRKIAEAGDILISVRAPVGPTNLCAERSCIGRGLAAIRLLEDIPPLLWLFYLRFIEKKVANMGTGSTFTAISRSHLESIPIPFPPLAEQKRIVTKIEDLLQEQITIKKALQNIPPLINKFRPSILTIAFCGKLTEQEPNDESTVELLERIKLLKKQLEIKQIELDTVHLDNLPQLPKTWLWVRLGELIESMKNGLYKRVEFYGKGIPCLRMYNIENGEIVWKNVKEMLLTSKEVEEYGLHEGDILLNRVNSRELVGKAAVIPSGLGNVVFESKNIRIRTWNGFIEPKYVTYFLQTRHARDQIELECKQTVGMATVSQKDIIKWLIPLAPYSEQKRIVLRINELFDYAIQLEKIVESTMKKMDRIEQSMLAKAFRGELVPQDPNDEPTSILLENIKNKYVTNIKIKTRRKPKISPPKIQLRSISDILKEMGESTVEQVFQASGKSISEFWDKLVLEINEGRIERIEKGGSVFLKVKD